MLALAVIPCFAASAIIGGVEGMRRGIGKARPGAVFATALLAALGLFGLVLGLLIPDGRCGWAAECGSDLTTVRDTSNTAISFELAFAGFGLLALLFAINSASHKRFRSASVSTVAAVGAFALWAVMQAPFLAGA